MALSFIFTVPLLLFLFIGISFEMEPNRNKKNESAKDFTMKKAAFSDDQKLELKKYFNITPYPSKNEKIELAGKVNLTWKQVHTWFHNKRNKENGRKRDSGGNASQSATDTDSTLRNGRFGDDKIFVLEAFYKRKRYPSRVEKRKLVDKVNLTRLQVEKWFQHRRQKEKKGKRDSGGNAYQSATDTDFIRRNSAFSDDKIFVLEAFYKRKRYPSRVEKIKLVDQVNLTRLQVANWFHHRRQNEKKGKGDSGCNANQSATDTATLSRKKSAKKRVSENREQRMTGKKKAKKEISPNVDECAREKSVGKSVEESGGYTSGVLMSDPSRFGYTVINARCENCKSIIQDLIKEYRIQTTALDLLFYTSSWTNFCNHYEERSKRDVCLGMHKAFIDTIYEQMPYTKAGDKTGHSQILCEGIHYCPF